MSSPASKRGSRAPTHRRSQPGRGDAARRIAARSAIELPTIVYPEQLPVSARRAEIARAIESHQVVIVAGETGSGKTTQLPKIALELGRGRTGQIGHTQPRRIAARTVAERIATELGIPLGDVVGYQVRFTDTSSESTLVKVMTDGILLAQIQRDPMLWAYDTLIIDEAHERSLNIDFILGYLTRLLPQRPDLKVIITSATIDSQRFAEHFHAADGAPAPIIEVTGRTYPVEIRYRPLEETHAEDQPTAICTAVAELMAAGPGDILVFCSGEREIRDAADALTDAYRDRIMAAGKGGANALEILPLFARLSAAEQHRVFAPHPGRRIVLATNVAETSLTVPGIRYVVDPGTARISRYSKATKVQRLPIEPISQASANQRAGRCGRVADGICIRLYSEEDFDSRPEFTEPEILRTSLASVILHMVSSGVARSPQDVASFPFVDPPDARNVRDGVNLLLELAALATEPAQQTGGTASAPSRTRLTDIGRQLAGLPIDPRLGRMVIESVRTGAAREVIIIAAALSIQDPRERPVEERERADQLHRRFADPHSDFLTYLNLWEYLRRERKRLSGNAFRRKCRSEYINYLRVREWQDVVTQLRQLTREIGLSTASSARTTTSSTDDAEAGQSMSNGNPTAGELRREWDADAIHHALLAGLLSQIGMLQVTEVRAGTAPKRTRRPGPAEYLGARGAKFAIFPGSVLAKKPPSWIMAGELVETGRLWARQVAQIRPEWAESLATHLTKRTYSEPRWSAKRGAAIVDERVLLYGVPIVAARPVLLGKIDAELARDLFIRHALVGGEWRTHHRFFAHNRDLLEAAEDTENRLRRRGLVIDDEALVQFYDERIPASIVSARHFDTWWKKTRHASPDLLTYTPDMVLREQADPGQFPDHWSARGMSFELAYEFDPTSPTDGVRVTIPISVLNQVEDCGFDWQVPGLRIDLVTALIRTLPKPLRTQLVPAPDTARTLIGALNRHPGCPDGPEPEPVPITRALGDVIFDDRALDVPDDAWDISRLPGHVRMTFDIVDDDGALLARGKELAVLRAELAGELQASLTHTLAEAAQIALAEDIETAPAISAKPGDHLPKVTASWSLDRSQVSEWDFGSLPEQVEQVGPAGLPVRGYPALVDEGSSVAVRVLPSAAAAQAAMPAGVCRLLLGAVGLSTARITSRLGPKEKLPLATSAYPSVDALIVDCQMAALAAIVIEIGPWPRRAEDYEHVREIARDALEDRVYSVVQEVAGILAAARELNRELDAVTSMAVLTSVHDIRTHLDHVLAAGFVWRAGASRLGDVRRYVAAEAYRLQRLGQNSAREASCMWQLGQVREAYDDALDSLPPGTPVPSALAEVEWMLEEFRVSLFAQQLGTAYPVSDKRIRKAISAGLDSAG